MRRTASLRWSAALLLIVGGATVPATGCGSDKSTSDGSHAPSDVANLSGPGFDLSGGSATGPGGAGGDGGDFTARSDRAFTVSPGSAPVPPNPPSSSVLNTLRELSSDRSLSGTTEIEGKVADPGPGDVRSVTVDGGDLLVTGTLERTAPGAGFSLSATGILHLTGSVRTTGGPVTLRASQIVISGTIETTGAGVAGDGSGVRGGAGGAITIESSGEIVVTSALRFRGGRAATSGAGAVGGEGGLLSIRGPVVRLFGALDGRGGAASAASEGTGVRGGPGGRISIGTPTPATTISLRSGRFSVGGGSGDRSGGKGGTFDVQASTDGIELSGTFVAGGGDSAAAPGAGGRFRAMSDIMGGDLRSGATILVSGGSASSSASDAPGGAGGRIDLSAWFDPTMTPAGSGGSIELGPSSALTADGGASAGVAEGGKGGTIHLEIPEGHVSIAGLMAARGGAARGSGKGGLGGFLWTATDANANALGGDTIVESGAMLDASGGASASGAGGDAQWSSTPDEFLPEVIPVAVLLDADSVLGGPNAGGIVENRGTIVARGGRSGGHGGDVYFHGRSSGTREPERGDVQNEGEGAGGNGVFTSD
jgi:hypothetical protein